MGRPPKAIEEKRRLGNPGKRALPSAGALAVVAPVEPSDYELAATDSLDKVLEAGVHWIASTDGPKVALLREALEYLEQLKADPRTKPAEVTAQFKAVSSMLSDLGFDPTARSRLGLAEVKAQSTLEKLRAQRER